jgi:hypothetical protein
MFIAVKRFCPPCPNKPEPKRISPTDDSGQRIKQVIDKNIVLFCLIAS